MNLPMPCGVCGRIYFVKSVLAHSLEVCRISAYIRRLCMLTCVCFLNKDWRIMDVCLCTAVRAEKLNTWTQNR